MPLLMSLRAEMEGPLAKELGKLRERGIQCVEVIEGTKAGADPKVLGRTGRQAWEKRVRGAQPLPVVVLMACCVVVYDDA